MSRTVDFLPTRAVPTFKSTPKSVSKGIRRIIRLSYRICMVMIRRVAYYARLSNTKSDNRSGDADSIYRSGFTAVFILHRKMA